MVLFNNWRCSPRALSLSQPPTRGAAVDLRQLAIDREHKEHGVLGDRNAVAGVKACDADAAFATRIEIDVVDAGAELLDEAELLPGRHRLFGDRRGHDKGDVRITDGGNTRRQGGFVDEDRTLIRRHGGFDRGLDVWMKFVEDSDSDHVHSHFQSANKLTLYRYYNGLDRDHDSNACVE
jgi:hypothetical protein